ncbi:hypothetical protein POTOM_056945 [Populus tomentosa]|uniref:Uncharacterized protein n=1 Tax=Populus tomentosa TaxID=118781 RepID=A0A8X7XVK6_POPTO|nr:hypothetical protein POTOM_056945 [Populus tomentosa]
MFLKNVPGEVISTRVSSAEQQDVAVNQHPAAALARICSYLETHKHFKYDLYQFQLFMNSSSQEEAVKHLDNAKENFHKDGDLQKQDLMATIEESDTRRGDFQFDDVSFAIAFK